MSPVNTIDEIRAVVSAWTKEKPLIKQITSSVAVLAVSTRLTATLTLLFSFLPRKEVRPVVHILSTALIGNKKLESGI